MAQPLHGQTQLLRSALRTRSELTRDDGGRLVDVGIELRVVRQDPAGTEYLRGKPLLGAVALHRIGGLWDTVERRYAGETECPVVWYVGPRQAAFLLAIWERPLSGERSLLISAEGGGKTVLMAQAAHVFVLACARIGVFGAILLTAPTHSRLDTFVHTVCDQAIVDSPHDSKEGAFARYYVASKNFVWVTGHEGMCRATKKASAATGSPIQGQTALASFDDELQDTVENGADPDIEARLRGAQNSRRVCTATAKDSSEWRSFREAKGAGADWTIERIRFDENPFVWPDHWDRLKRNVSAREWQRRGLAMDVGPELMVYTAWERTENLRPVPQIGAEDVTAEILRPWGQNLSVLVGHDPGKLCDVSIMLKAYRLRGQARHVWYVVDELTTLRTTTEQHVKALLERLRAAWQCNELDWRGQPAQGGRQAFIRADPYSNSGNDSSHPDKSVYTIFRKAGLFIQPAALTTSVTSVKVAAVPKDAGIKMVDGLLCNAEGERRLFIATGDDARPVAPRLVEAIEMSERDGNGDAEAQRKDKHDLSHWCAALRYALWVLEKPRMGNVA